MSSLMVAVWVLVTVVRRRRHSAVSGCQHPTVGYLPHSCDWFGGQLLDISISKTEQDLAAGTRLDPDGQDLAVLTCSFGQ